MIFQEKIDSFLKEISLHDFIVEPEQGIELEKEKEVHEIIEMDNTCDGHAIDEKFDDFLLNEISDCHTSDLVIDDDKPLPSNRRLLDKGEKCNELCIFEVKQGFWIDALGL